MADIRINSLPSTATSFNTDDYIAIDGASAGTRKMLAATLPLTDVTFGTSGPSAKSSIAARAARQGLGYSGIAGANVTVSVAAYGTAPFTNAVTFSVDSLSAQQTVLDSNNGILVFITTGGSLQVYNRVGAAYLYQSASGLIVAGKINQFVYSRGSVYLNGVLLQGSISDTSNYTGTTVYFGGDYAGGTPLFGKIYGPPYIYNRALSAAEVVSLYEAGAPAGADYNSASNTAINTSNWNNSNWPYTSFTGVSSTAFTAVMSIITIGIAEIIPTPVNGTAGQRIRITVSATLTSGATPTLRLFDASYNTVSNAVALTAGSNTVELVATAAFTKIGFYTTGVTSYAVSSVSVTRLGLLLAPDAAQAGNGYIWNDQSGNLAQIVLPSSGVAWNLPSIAGNRIRGTTSTNGNQQLLGASTLLPAECQITHVRARARSGTPTITIGTASGGAQIVASVALSTTWLNCTIALTGGIVSSADDIWVGSDSTAVVETDIAFQPLDF